MQRNLYARSSDGLNNHEVQFILDAGKLSVFYNCPAGALGKHCKHKFSLLNGDTTLLADANHPDSLSLIREWLKRSAYPALLVEVDLAETEAKNAQLKVQNLKKRLEKAMKEGI